jgi:hypothetical protein
MNDPADEDIHNAEGPEPYPTPAKTEVVGQSGDVDDPGRRTADAPHDRATARDGSYTTGTDAMNEQLSEEGEREDWKHGRMQQKPLTMRP